MATILLSIKPMYVKKIFSGEKKYEYRKHLSQVPVEKIIVYSTDPEQKVVGEIKISGTLKMSPTRLWEQTKHEAGISREKFRKYFKGCQTAFAYQLGETTMFKKPKELSDYGISQAPQSFVYINREE